jgi:hypothetical protein
MMSIPTTSLLLSPNRAAQGIGVAGLDTPVGPGAAPGSASLPVKGCCSTKGISPGVTPAGGKDRRLEEMATIGSVCLSLEPQIHVVSSAVARATLSETKMKTTEECCVQMHWPRRQQVKYEPVVSTRLSGRHFVPGIMSRTPRVSPASQRCDWMMKVSSEHVPMKAKALDETARNAGVALRRTLNATTGYEDVSFYSSGGGGEKILTRTPIYGCLVGDGYFSKASQRFAPHHALYVNFDSCPSSKTK